MPREIEVEVVPLAQLAPYAGNARTHSDQQVKQIAASIAEFGFVNPVLIDAAGVLVAGHGRLMAAKQLKMTTVPAIRLGHLTPAAARALRIADNQIALNSSWDDVLLAADLARLLDDGFDMGRLGFNHAVFEAARNGVDEDAAAPEPPTVPVSRCGDLWLLGRHRLRCGSSTDATDVAALLDGACPHLMVTDPPYGVKYDPAWRTRAGVSDSARMGVVLNDDIADWREAWALFPGDVAYVWYGSIYAGVVVGSLAACGFDLRSQIVWAKKSLVMGRGHYHWQHETCCYAVRRGRREHWHGPRKETTLWHIATQADAVADAATIHSTQKPVECMRRPMENSSKPNDQVYEPFSGSGSTLIAGEMAERQVFAMELNPAYVDVAVRRWQRFTGLVATLAGDGGTLDEVAAARGIPAAA